MALSRFFLRHPIEGDLLALSAEDEHHIRDVLRLGVGSELCVVEPGGRESIVRVTGVDRGAVTGVVVRIRETAPLPRVVLFQGLAKGSKMDDIVRAATELGVERIVPVSCERAVVKLTSSAAVARLSRWRRIAEAAAKQSQRAEVPAVSEPCDINDVGVSCSDVTHLIVFWEAGEAVGVGRALERLGASDGDVVGVVVGPEGGFSASEVAGLVDRGGVVATMGRTILRTETAGPTAVALVAYELGGLGGGDSE